ncbi:MAG: urea transporter [Desulfobulbus sp.]|nr:urea transporter [Desulfobulbus sp.]
MVLVRVFQHADLPALTAPFVLSTWAVSTVIQWYQKKIPNISNS